MRIRTVQLTHSLVEGKVVEMEENVGTLEVSRT